MDYFLLICFAVLFSYSGVKHHLY